VTTLSEVTTDVAVVGAGPSGLMAAVCLRKLGVAVTVIDSKDGPTTESRALALQARSLEIYDQLGLAEAVLNAGKRAPAIVPGHRTRTFRSVNFGEFGRNLTPYPGIYILEQSHNERILGEALSALGGDLRWRRPLTALHIGEGSHPVSVVSDGPDGELRLRARWCVGADGASSIVRHRVGIAFEGSTNPLVFYVSDSTDATGLVEGCINMRISRDDFLLAFPMGAPEHHRLLGVVEGDPEDPDLEEGVRGRLAAEFGVSYRRSAWFSSYRVHHRLAAEFRRGPVFLVGDAAHVHSPVGAQGMNTGLQDAHNLACKIADVVQGRAGPDLLERYEQERRPVARRLVKTTDAAFSRITSSSRIARFARNRVVPAIAPLAVRLVPHLIGTDRLFGYLAQLRIRYVTTDVGRSKIVGRRLPWSGENFDALRSFAWQIHGYGSDPKEIERISRRLGIEGHRFTADPRGRLSSSKVYLIRPDGFVAAEADPAGASASFLGPGRVEAHQPSPA
jgi:2-polyprenyl-6-methoxyphenol hydroxylase-like FAD-dependent oxidoreductase